MSQLEALHSLTGTRKLSTPAVVLYLDSEPPTPVSPFTGLSVELRAFVTSESLEQCSHEVTMDYACLSCNQVLKVGQASAPAMCQLNSTC